MSYYQSFTQSANRSSNAIKPSESQINSYYQQCERKRITPQDVSKMSRAELSAELQRIFDLPLPARETQITALKEVLAELVNAGVPGVRMPSEKFFLSLNVQSASKWIDDVRAIRAQNLGMMPPSDEQLDKLVRMMMFPDIEWESIVGERTETHEYYEADDEDDKLRYNKESIHYTTNTSVNRKVFLNEYIGEGENIKQLWRFMTKDEFREELKVKLNHTQASRIISEHQGTHEAWARTRLSRSQYNTIRQLENRMANLFTSRPMGEPIAMLDGGEADVPFALASRKEEYSPRAYEPIAEELIILFDQDEADMYINQLQYELKDSELRSSTNAQELPYSEFVHNVTKEGVEEIRDAVSEADKRTKEFKAINNFMHGLSSMVGFGFEQQANIHGEMVLVTVDSLRADVLQVFFDNGTQEAKNDMFLQIADFVKYTVESEAVTFNQVLSLAEGVELANEVLDYLLEDKAFAQLLIALQRKQFARR